MIADRAASVSRYPILRLCLSERGDAGVCALLGQAKRAIAAFAVAVAPADRGRVDR